MEQAINLSFVKLKRGAAMKRSTEEAALLCKNAGFLQFDYLSPLSQEDYLETARKERDFLDANGLKVFQSHCPFFRYEKDGLRKFQETAPKAARAAALLGADFLVLHADEIRMTPECPPGEILRKTREYLKPVIDLCQELGVRPAIENLFEENHGFKERSRYTSEVEEVLAVIQSFPGSGIGCCWDSGHHHVSFGDEACIPKLKVLAPYIVCTHIHDNLHGIDLHKPAFFGTLPWEQIIPILKQYNYQGPLSWEFVYDRVADCLYPAYLDFIHAIGDYLANLK